MSLNEGRVRPSSSARVQSLCADTDMHRGHRWGYAVNSKWMACSKRRSVFSHTQTVVHSGDVKKFLHTQARTGRHIVEACPQPQPNSFTRLSRLTAVYVSEYRLRRFSDKVLINSNRHGDSSSNSFSSPPLVCHKPTPGRIRSARRNKY